MSSAAHVCKGERSASAVPNPLSSLAAPGERALPCPQHLHKVCGSSTGQGLQPRRLLEASSGHQGSCSQYGTGLMNSRQMLLPWQLGLFQDRSQDGLDQSRALGCARPSWSQGDRIEKEQPQDAPARAGGCRAGARLAWSALCKHEWHRRLLSKPQQQPPRGCSVLELLLSSSS